MAMQHAGLGFSKLIFLIGAGYTGTIVLQNRKLSDILGDIQSLVAGLEKPEDSLGSDTEALADQVRRLAMEVRNMGSSRQITVLNGDSSHLGSLTSVAMPAAILAAVGYGYMWLKGLSFSDIMYVTKHNMATAVASMTKHLDQVSSALSAAKRHLSQRIENLDGKLDDQREMSKVIKNEVTEVRNDLSQIGDGLDTLQRLVSFLDGKIMSLDQKQEYANIGIYYLCNFVGGKDAKMSELLKALPKSSNPHGILGLLESSKLQGLKQLVESLDSGNLDSVENIPKSLVRVASVKV